MTDTSTVSRGRQWKRRGAATATVAAWLATIPSLVWAGPLFMADPEPGGAGSIDPQVTANWNWLPANFVLAVRNAAGSLQAVMIVALVIGFIAAVALWAISKLVTSTRGQQVGATACLIVLIAAALVAGGSGLIRWATGIPVA
jgi:hypothetical protein